MTIKFTNIGRYKLVAAVYDEVPEGEDGSPSVQRKRTGYITSGRRKLGRFEVLT